MSDTHVMLTMAEHRAVTDALDRVWCAVKDERVRADVVAALRVLNSVAVTVSVSVVEPTSSEARA